MEYNLVDYCKSSCLEQMEPDPLRQRNSVTTPDKPEPACLQPRPTVRFKYLNSDLSGETRDLMEEEIKKEVEASSASRVGKPKPEKRKMVDWIRSCIENTYWRAHTNVCLLREIDVLSNKILQLLRTPGLGPVPSNELVRQVPSGFSEYHALELFPELNPKSSIFIGARNNSVEVKEPHVTGNNSYFGLTQQSLVEKYGHAFVTKQTGTFDPSPYAKPPKEHVVDVNVHFFAGFLGGDKRFNHDVVFYSPERRFYFFDPFTTCYCPTTAEKLFLNLSLTIQGLCWGLTLDEGQNILSMFRRDELLNEILTKAQVLLSVEQSYFDGAEFRKRLISKDHHARNIAPTVIAFVKQHVEKHETGLLPISDCLVALETFSNKSGVCLPDHEEITGTLKEVMRDMHNLGMRNDLILPGGRCVKGWKGLRLQTGTQKDEFRGKEVAEVRESGRSVESVTPLEQASTAISSDMVLLS